MFYQGLAERTAIYHTPFAIRLVRADRILSHPVLRADRQRYAGRRARRSLLPACRGLPLRIWSQRGERNTAKRYGDRLHRNPRSASECDGLERRGLAERAGVLKE